MAKPQRAWRPDIFDRAARRAATTPPGPLDPSGPAAEPLLIDEPLATAPVVVVTAPPPRRRPGGDNSGLVGLLLGALAGAGLTLLATPLSGPQLRRQLQGVAQQASDSARQAGETMAQKVPKLAAQEPTAPADGTANRS